MSKDKILEAYENLADRYNALIDHKPHNAYYDRPNTLSLLGDPNGQVILDAACGPGKYSEILIDQGAQITGFDISPKMISHAKERNPEGGTFSVQDISQPFQNLGDATFDSVICALAMHYIEDWTTTLREFHRVLKPNGQLIISIEHPIFEYTYHQSKKYFEVEPVKCVWNGFGTPVEVHSYRRSLQDCLNPLIQNGFVIDKVLEPLPLPEFEAIDPRHFEELNTFPAFMCIRSIKSN